MEQLRDQGARDESFSTEADVDRGRTVEEPPDAWEDEWVDLGGEG